MGDLHASNAARLVYALKPMSWPKLLVPAFFGQALGYALSGSFSLGGALFGALYVVTHLTLVVLLNDWADRRVDAVKRSMFPSSCSPKTIPDSILGERAVLAMGCASLAACAAVAFVAERVVDRPGFFVLGLAGIAVFLSYSFPPLKLNYRGGGELLEAFGVGYFLPAIEAYLQSGSPEVFTSPLYVGTVILAGSSAVASGLSDERSDVEGGKRTFVTHFGNAKARGAIVYLAYLGAVGLALGAILSGFHLFVAIAPLALVAPGLFRIRRLAPTAVTDAFSAQAALKNALHVVIWRGTSLLGAGIAAQTFLDASPR